MDSIENLRQEIDSLDSLLVATLGRRMHIVAMIATEKEKAGMLPLQPARWEQLLSDRKNLGTAHNLNTKLVQDIFEVLHHHSLQLQQKNTVSH